jgi:hypothetical protein
LEAGRKLLSHTCFRQCRAATFHCLVQAAAVSTWSFSNTAFHPEVSRKISKRRCVLEHFFAE